MTSRLVLTGAFTLALIGSISCGGAGGVGGGGPVGTTVELTAANTFSPQSVTVDRGAEVTWSNSSPVNHRIMHKAGGMMDDGPMSDGMYPGGMHSGDRYTFHVPMNAAPGTHYYYYCPEHGTAGDGMHMGTGMAGEIVVR